MLSTVPVVSRRAYKSLSAGASSADWPMTAMPIRFTWLKNSPFVKDMRKPGTDSSLSRVPPVKPRPRPLILATFTPVAATRGAVMRVVVSAMPPVLCLSTVMPFMGDRSTTSPESRMAVVNAAVSSSLMPLRYTAMSHAAA